VFGFVPRPPYRRERTPEPTEQEASQAPELAKTFVRRKTTLGVNLLITSCTKICEKRKVYHFSTELLSFYNTRIV
jgi:hypothetical protein